MLINGMAEKKLMTDFTKIPSHEINLNNDDSEPTIAYNITDYIKYLENNNLIYETKLINPDISEIIDLYYKGECNELAFKFKQIKIPVVIIQSSVSKDYYHFKFKINNGTHACLMLNLKIDNSVIYDINKKEFIDTLLFLNNEKDYKKYSKYYTQSSSLKQEQIINIMGRKRQYREGIDKSYYSNINDNTILLDISTDISYHLGISRQEDTILRYLLNDGLDFYNKYTFCVNYDVIMLLNSERYNIIDNNISIISEGNTRNILFYNEYPKNAKYEIYFL